MPDLQYNIWNLGGNGNGLRVFYTFDGKAPIEMKPLLLPPGG